LEWFENWGHQLEKAEPKLGKFERSISYTNWLTSKTTNIKDIYKKCIKDYSSIFQTLNELKPRLMFLLSAQLLYALNSQDCLKIATQIFGKCEKPFFVQHDITYNGKKLRRFKIGFQKFDKCFVISLPHPTGSRNLDEKYIYSFRKEIGDIISEWKSYSKDIC